MLTIAIPTLNRGRILVETIERLLALQPRAEAILIADQTKEHPADVEARLRAWHDAGEIQWMRLPEPSIPRAMNDALEAATTPLVLFFDDDIIPDPAVAGVHVEAHRDAAIWAVAGQVLQPGEEPGTFAEPENDLEFKFRESRGRFLVNVMAGNLSVKRDRALGIGGFDENYLGAAYRFETDFAMRLAAAGGKIWFEPRASIRHLKLSTGGLRTLGDHRSTPIPAHSVGDYYFAMHHVPGFRRYALTRLRKNVLTRHLLAHPWLIPGKLVGELRGYLLAKKLHGRGARLR